MSASRASSALRRDVVETTLAIIKPEAIKNAEDIENIITNNGFDIIEKRTVLLTEDDVLKLYEEHIGQPYFQNLIDHMTSDNVILLHLSKLNAIQELKQLMGPTNVLEARVYWPKSIRAMYGEYNFDGEGYKNGIHGSENMSSAVSEIKHFFPDEEDSNPPNIISEYLQTNINTTLTEGLSQLCKEKPNDPIVWLADWLLMHNPNKERETI